MKSRTVFWLTAALMLLSLRQEKRWNTQGVFDWDAGGYFAYLPAVFIYHDPGRVDSLGRLVQQRLPAQDHDVTRLGIHPVGNGKYISKYPLGVALSQLPWFLGAHLYAHVENVPAAGHSWPYQEAAMLAGTAYAILGLWVLRKLLRRYYSDRITAWTIAGIGLGTNYFVYSTHEAANAHAVLFLWQASLLYCTARWYETLEQRWALGMGLFLGLATLTRFSEAIYVLIPMVWGLTSFAALRQRPLLLARHAGQLALAAGLAVAVVSLQFIFWRIASGHWILEEYTGEHFDFAHPHIIDGLFSMRRGWLVYTPLVALMLVGILRLRHYVPAALPAVLLLLPVLLYITFSWGQWWYGWGFSARPLVSLYPLLALPLGAVLASIRFSNSLLRTSVYGFVLLCIMLNLWQGWQYVNNKLPGEGITLELYKERFFEVPPLYPAESTPYTPPLPPPPPPRPTW